MIRLAMLVRLAASHRLPRRGAAAKCRKCGAPSRLHHCYRRISRSRRREHVFICMFYPSAALNPTHPDRKVRSTARRARAVAASRSPPATTVPRSRTDSPAKLCPKSTGADARRVLIATASGHRNRARGRPQCRESNHDRVDRRTPHTQLAPIHVNTIKFLRKNGKPHRTKKQRCIRRRK